MATKGSTIDKGGFVENVANASPEPEEKKVRGQQFSYAELGGVLAQDVEDRRGFEDGGSTTLDRWKLALEQHQPIELTPEEIRSEEHFQRIKDEPGLIESAPLINAAAALYGIPRSTVSAYKGVRDARRLNKLQKSDLYHGGYGWQSGYYREGLQGEKLWRPENIALWSTPSVNYAKYHARKRAEQLSSRTFDQHGKGASNIGVWQAKTSDINKFVILDRPSKQFKSQVKDEIIRLTNNKADPNRIERLLTIKKLQNYLADPKKYKGTHGIGYKGSGQEPLLNLLKKHDYDGVVALEDLKIIMQGGPKAAQSQSQFVFLRRPELNKLSNEKVREMMDAAGFKKFYNEGGLVEDMDRLGLRKGGWLSKRREARQQDIYDKGYSRFMNWAVDQFTPFGLLGGISNLSDVDADRFPRLHNLGVQTGKLYDTAGGATKGWLTLRKGKSRYDERGFLKDSDSYETDYDELNAQIQAMSSPQQESGLFGGIGRKGRQARRAAKRAEEGNWFERISGEITDDTRYAMRDRNTILSRLAARAGPQSDRASSEAEQNIREAKAAHRRVHYATGGTADLDVLLDDLKTTYDSLSPEEESELQRMITSNDTTRI